MNDGSEMNDDQCFADVFNAFDASVALRPGESVEHKNMKKRTSPSNLHQEAGDGLNAEWLKPFDEGWQREIVLRNTNQNSGFKKADVYYYTPDNKKLRSFPEIESFLQTTESSLSLDCFTFKKERIHVEPSEIVRQAAHTRGRNRGGTNSTQSINDVVMDAFASTSASGSSSAVAKESPLEVHTPSVGVNIEKSNRGSASRKRSQSSPSVSSAIKQPRTKKAQMPDDWSAKCCSIYCFGHKWPVWPIDVFCANCGYGFHFACINKSCFNADYFCEKCAAENEPNSNCNTTADSKDVASVARSIIPNIYEQSNSQIASATLEKPEVLLSKPLPRFYTCRMSSCQRLLENAHCIGSLPTSSPLCNFDNEQSVFMPNGIQIQPAEDEMKKGELPNGKRKLTDMDTCRTADSEARYYHLAYDSLEHIFKYLSVVDLLNCRLVCKTWKNIASQPSLWNSKLCDFPNRHQNLNSKRKNARRENPQEDDSVDSVDAFVNMPHFNRVNLGSCQCAVVEMVVDGNRDMKLFSAELFMDNRKNIAENQWPDDVILDMKVFSGMDKLEVLRLRAVGKLIPLELDQISQVKSLRTLSLTSLHRVSGHELMSIFSLPKLTVLELGDCYEWDQEIFKKLGEMQNMEVLRLEARDEDNDSGLGAALLKLKNLRRLELARYTIGLELSNVLSKVSHLQLICIWAPLLEDKMKTARRFKHLITGVQEMTFLRGLYLGVIAPAAEDSFNWNVSIPILSENGLDYELTDIHHVYRQLCDKLTNAKIMVQAVPLYNLQTGIKL